MRQACLAFLTLLFSFSLTSVAMAYIGPGPGLSMIGSLLTLLAGVAIALLMVLIYPIRLMMKRKKASKEGSGNQS